MPISGDCGELTTKMRMPFARVSMVCIFSAGGIRKASVLMTVYEKFARIADEVTSIPAYVYGDTDIQGAGRTASGLSSGEGLITAVRDRSEKPGRGGKPDIDWHQPTLQTAALDDCSLPHRHRQHLARPCDSR